MNGRTATETLEQIRQTAEEVKDDSAKAFPEAASVGDTWRQGDLLIELLESVPSGYEKVETVLQLAPGETKGARHCLESADGVTMYMPKSSENVLAGPVFELRQKNTVTHPEHGNVTLDSGVYGVTYQRVHAEEVRRVVD